MIEYADPSNDFQPKVKAQEVPRFDFFSPITQ